jgi:hypothetical protein
MKGRPGGIFFSVAGLKWFSRARVAGLFALISHRLLDSLPDNKKTFQQL